MSKGKDFFVLDTQSKEVRKIFPFVLDSIGPPRPTRDGRNIYFTRRVTDADIWLITLR